MLPLLEALEEAGPLPRDGVGPPHDGVGPPHDCGEPHPQGHPLASLVPLSAVSGLGAAGESYAVRWSTGEVRAPPARAPASRGGKMRLLRRPRPVVRDTSVGLSCKQEVPAAPARGNRGTPRGRSPLSAVVCAQVLKRSGLSVRSVGTLDDLLASLVR